ncbi:MAG: exonuclease, partial [Planctomycetota bacterium]
MLEHTFCHLRGIGPKTERRLWDAGLHSWGAVRDGAMPVRGRRAEALRRGVEASEGHLAAGDAAWFAGGLAAAEH